MACASLMNIYQLFHLFALFSAVFCSRDGCQNYTCFLMSSESRTIQFPYEERRVCAHNAWSRSLFSPPVRDLHVVVEMISDVYSSNQNQFFQSLAFVNWNLPDDSDNLTGFLVHLQSSDNQINICYLLTFTRSTRSSPGKDTEFQFRFPLQPNNYTVRVHGLPESSSIKGSPYVIPQSRIIIKPRQRELNNSPALWITDFVLCNNSCSRTVDISFELAPDAYNFRDYTVSLRSAIFNGQDVDRTNLCVAKNQRHGSVVFTNITPGQYVAEITPVNINRFGDCRCRCEGIAVVNYCQHKVCPDFGCIIVESDIFSIDSVGQNECYFKIDDFLWPTKMTGIAIGCFLAVVSVVLIAYILLRTKHLEIDVNKLTTQNLFLLYSNDHKIHHDVIHCLVHFMNEHCFCSVRTMHNFERLISENLCHFVKNICTSDERILLINSDGVFRSFISSCSVTRDPLDAHVSFILNQLQQEIMHTQKSAKLTIARFDYTKSNGIAEQLNYQQHEFLLMQEMEMLILNIHGQARKKGQYTYHMKNIQDSYLNTREGQDLHRAILSMKNATKCNHNESLQQWNHHRSSQQRTSDLSEVLQPLEPYLIPPLADSSSCNSEEEIGEI